MSPIRAVLCADDFGFDPFVSKGILTLAQHNRLSAVSCMANFPDFQQFGPSLNQLPHIDVGLHLNLTEGADHQTLVQLLMKSHLRRLSKAKIQQQILMQLEQFVSVMKRQPDFIDGHQHVHHLPVVRECLLEVINTHFKAHKPYVRLTHPKGLNSFFGHHLFNMKANIIGLTGGALFKKRCDAFGIPTNASFAGIYAFSRAPIYPTLFEQFIKQTSEGGIIMCHPGLPSDNLNDPLKDSRYQEFNYLMSDRFLEGCHKSGIAFCRFSHVGVVIARAPKQ